MTNIDFVPLLYEASKSADKTPVTPRAALRTSSFYRFAPFNSFGLPENYSPSERCERVVEHYVACVDDEDPTESRLTGKTLSDQMHSMEDHRRYRFMNAASKPFCTAQSSGQLDNSLWRVYSDK